jgi:hypothetical protein
MHSPLRDSKTGTSVSRSCSHRPPTDQLPSDPPPAAAVSPSISPWLRSPPPPPPLPPWPLSSFVSGRRASRRRGGGITSSSYIPFRYRRMHRHSAIHIVSPKQRSDGGWSRRDGESKKRRIVLPRRRRGRGGEAGGLHRDRRCRALRRSSSSRSRIRRLRMQLRPRLLLPHQPLRVLFVHLGYLAQLPWLLYHRLHLCKLIPVSISSTRDNSLSWRWRTKAR